MNPQLSQALTEISEQLSMIIAMLVCIIFAIVRWKRHPAVSMMVTAACLLLLLQVFVVAAIYAWVPEAIIKSANPTDLASFRQTVYMIIALCSNSMVALAFALLVTGIFMKRPRPY
jgi:uncharacterized membrane protein